jgi:hypothetical protein
MDLTTCPDCRSIAEVLERFVLEGTDGPVEHARVRCIAGHWFVLRAASLASPPLPRSARRRSTARGLTGDNC